MDTIPAGSWRRGYLAYTGGSGAQTITLYDAEGVARPISSADRIVLVDLAITNDTNADTVDIGYDTVLTTKKLMSYKLAASSGVVQDFLNPVYFPKGQSPKVLAPTTSLIVCFTAVLIKS